MIDDSLRSGLSRVGRAPSASNVLPGAHVMRVRRGRILLWATLTALIVGVLSAAQPIDDYLRAARNVIRRHAPSGDIVVIGIDDKSLDEVGRWPWPRRKHGDLIDRLHELGVERIFFDVLFTGKSTANDDRALAASISRAGNVTLAASYAVDRFRQTRTELLPTPRLRARAKIASIHVKYSNLSSVSSYLYSTRIGGVLYPSVPSALARVSGPEHLTFPIDYSVDLRGVPYVSAADILDRRRSVQELRGKTVIVAPGSRDMGDQYYLPGHGLVNGVMIMVAAAETLKGGASAAFGWFAPLSVAFLLAIVHLFARRRWQGRLAIGLAIAGLTIGPLFAEMHHVVFDTVPALLLVGVVAISRAWANFRRSYKVRGNINATSGLPNLAALRGESLPTDAVLIGARVRNYAQITAALPPETERVLVEQITGRLALGASGARFYQGDEGVFVWVASAEGADADHLDALHALFRSPARVEGRSIDLSVTFGVDRGGSRELANRIGATLVAADEAAAEGGRWKAYDPARLADAEWKLSLLGQLDTAIDRGEVWVAYQPQLDLRSGAISGAEALVRWSHPEKGEVSPLEFVLAAEQHDRIEKLTRFVLTDAVRTAAEFNRRGIAFDVSVNLSARLLEKPGVTDMVRGILADARLEPERLTLEVTESAAMTSGRASIDTLEELGSLGITVSIDDYGTGFSTLEYFKLIPAAEVKIDKTFVDAIDRNASDRVMVRSTIELAHSLGRSVVAEGVETEQVLAELATLGCDKIQGYLIGRPMRAAQLSTFMDSAEKATAARGR